MGKLATNMRDTNNDIPFLLAPRVMNHIQLTSINTGGTIRYRILYTEHGTVELLINKRWEYDVTQIPHWVVQPTNVQTPPK
jgi:hypothetical protein